MQEEESIQFNFLFTPVKNKTEDIDSCKSPSKKNISYKSSVKHE